MKRLGFALLLVSSVAFAKGSYVDNGKTVTHDCAKDPEVSIAGNENTVTAVGSCTKIAVMGNKNKVTIASTKDLTINGNENTITVDAADTITTPGSKNTLTYRKGVSGDKVGVRNPGTGNNITQAK